MSRTSISARTHWSGNLPDHRAACGMGFVATTTGVPTHEVVASGVTALARLAHRGGLDADGKSGDGAGLLIQVPRAIFGQHTAVAVLFEWEGGAISGREVLAQALAAEGMGVADWRPAPVDPDALGEKARASAPRIWHAIITRPDVSDAEWEERLYRARRRAERAAAAQGVRMYIPSCSCRTIVYKGLMAGTHLAEFYRDLANPEATSQLAVFHQRYSTNTMPDWRLAQPFRFLAHNGEINTVAGNRAWMRAREAELEGELRPVVWPEGSDSASLDNVLELLVRRGFGTAEALMTLVPDAWEGRGDMAPRVRDFYRYQTTRFEPWDGPAALAFSDGVVAGAALDRNGLRPLRYQVTGDGLVVAASEAGVVPLDPKRVVERGRLGPGHILLVDTRDGSVLRNDDAKERVAAQHDYGLLADRMLVPVEHRAVEVEVPAELSRLHRAHGWGFEDVKMVIQAMAENAIEPTWSMGDDTPIAVLGRTRRRLYGYLRQRFAQVTNPPIDSLRERSVMSLRVVLGARGTTLDPEGDANAELRKRHHPAMHLDRPFTHRLLELSSPLLGQAELARILEDALVIDATFGPGESLREAVERIAAEAAAARADIVAISDRNAGAGRLPVPMLLAVGAVHERLLATGQRMQKDVVAIAGDAVEVHDVACLVTAGANAVHPYLALATAHEHDREDGEHRYRHALEHGLLKVMAKMGISCVSSYCGAEVFEALGLGAEVMQLCFPNVPSRVGGHSFADLEESLKQWHAEAWEQDVTAPHGELAKALLDHGRVRFRKAGEFHAYNPIAVRAAQKAARENDREAYARWRELSTMDPDQPQELRDLLRIRPSGSPIPIEQVEPAELIRTRFISTAMSLGALSPEAHTALSVAMNRIGARSNSGEGGEDPDHYSDGGPRLDNKIKQVASARFGVTPAYLKRADATCLTLLSRRGPGAS